MVRSVLLTMAWLIAATITANAWPDNNIRMVVPFAAGGTTDVVARLIAQRLSARLGHAVIVENIAGAAGNIGAEQVAKSAPDGYTILMATPGQAAMNQFMYSHMPYDTETAFTPLAYIASVPSVLLVSPKLNVVSTADLLTQMKARPEGANFGSAGMGSTGHLGGTLFAKETGIKATHIPYRGSAPMLQDLVAGNLQFAIDTVPGTMGFINSGTLQALAITGASRSPALPNVPNNQEAGIPGVEMSSWLVLLAPAATPAPIVDKINAETNASLQEPQLRDDILKLGAVPEGGSPAEVQSFLQAETAKWKRVIEITGVRID
jgi:tripartite-type tricarboxylate transporter receptor subunit TctC